MPSEYKDNKLILQRLRELRKEGRVSDLTEQLLFAPIRPAEELYLYGEDRWQIVNLADNPKHGAVLAQHRTRLESWMEETGDMGPESLEVYIMETEDQMKSTRNAESRERYRKNSKLYMQWRRVGK
jgi:hypothetical protein